MQEWAESVCIIFVIIWLVHDIHFDMILDIFFSSADNEN